MTTSFSTQPPSRPARAVELARASSTALRRLGVGASWPVALMFAISIVASVALFVLRPIEHGHAYQLGVRLTLLLSSIWGVCTLRPHWLHERRFLGVVVAAGLYCMVSRPLTIKENSEIVAAYRSAFAELDAGRNPYDSRSIVHYDERGEHVLGNFNYPPGELIPYYLVAKLAGGWDHRVLTVTLLVLQVAAWAVLWVEFRRVAPVAVLAFAPLLVFFELHTNVALTLLATAVTLALMRRPAHARSHGRWLTALAFGAALLTKFMVIPLFATYLIQRLPARPWREDWRASARVLAEASAALLVALALMLPFGVADVVRETVFFNLELTVRDKLTTFYPNVLSGTLTWLGLRGLFPALAVLSLGAAILWSRRLPLPFALVFSGSVFLLVSPTPELQYIPVMIYLGLWAALEPPRPATLDGPAPGFSAPLSIP